MKIMIVASFYILIKNFKSKLLPLLSLEMTMIILILYFFFCEKDSFASISMVYLLFLIMMVLDSVLGLCLLITSCRVTDNKSISLG